ncbi:MAG TPA: hypothetical protein VGN34_10080, partial [Ktedonobacteraceae bacterium]
MEYRTWSVQRSWVLYRVIFPVAAGMIMLIASLLPWLIDPLGARFSAWNLALDLGWQFRLGIFNYGILCVACALYIFLVAFRAWKTIQAGEHNDPEASRSSSGFVARAELTRVGLLCLVPLGLFFWQFLFIDLTSITELARHQSQAMLIKLHLGYGSAASFIAIDLATFDPLNLHSRLAVIVNNLAPGFFLPLISASLLLASRAFWPNPMYNSVVVQRGRRLVWLLGGALLLGMLLGRGPAALMSNFQAQHALSIGDYNGALGWLDTARLLNPE